MKSPKNAIMNDRSNMPAGGITRRNGASTGSVRSISTRFTVASPLPDELGGNQDSTARAPMITRYTVTNAQRRSRTALEAQAR